MTTGAIDIMPWIYHMTLDKEVGLSGNAIGSETPNGNFSKVFWQPIQLRSGDSIYELPAGSELVVYRKLQQFNGEAEATYGPKSRLKLATFFVKENDRLVQLLTIRMDGKVVVQRF